MWVIYKEYVEDWLYAFEDRSDAYAYKFEYDERDEWMIEEVEE